MDNSHNKEQSKVPNSELAISEAAKPLFSSPYQAMAFYHFTAFTPAELEQFKTELISASKKMGIKGLIVIAEEGFNGTVAGELQACENFESFLRSYPWGKDFEIKYSPSHFQPFRRFKVDLRPEIVTSKNLDIKVEGKRRHLSPKEWHDLLNSENPPVVIDTRNDYESRIGTFKGAIAPDIKKFNDFASYLEKTNIPKDKPLLMFCTGGIRCEKAIYEAERLGYTNSYQLDGGILKYFEEYPDGGTFDGECFVFDNRVAVDSKLTPTKKYKLCPLCGEPGNEIIECGNCHRKGILCENCLPKNACSKNCAHHLSNK
jgi:UPF0176 protein